MFLPVVEKAQPVAVMPKGGKFEGWGGMPKGGADLSLTVLVSQDLVRERLGYDSALKEKDREIETLKQKIKKIAKTLGESRKDWEFREPYEKYIDELFEFMEKSEKELLGLSKQ